MSEMEDVPVDICKLMVSPRAYAIQTQLLAGFRWLRRHNPVGRVHADGFDPFWAVTSYAGIAEISRQHKRFGNSARATALVPRATDELARSLTGGSPHLLPSLLQMDAPDHPRYRALIQPWFTRQSIDLLEDRIRQLASVSIDDLASCGGTCDFVRTVAFRIPLRVMIDILELPATDEPVLSVLIDELFRSQDEVAGSDLKASRDPVRHANRLIAAFKGFKEYFQPLLEERRRRPRDDLLSPIAIAEVDGAPIAQFEAIGYCMLLLTAGYHTTAAAISGAVWALCENAADFRKIKSDLGLVPKLAEEATRWVTPVHHMMRTAIEDTELRGHRIAKGDWLMLCYLSANRDEEAFDEPEHFRIDPERRRNLSFGHGAHVCLGQYLARLQMRIFFEEFLRRLAWIELSGTPRRMASVFLGGPRMLPIRFGMECSQSMG